MLLIASVGRAEGRVLEDRNNISQRVAHDSDYLSYHNAERAARLTVSVDNSWKVMPSTPARL